MDVVLRRHGAYPAAKRAAHYCLKDYFDEKAGMDLYPVLRDGENHLRT
jgi:hypothetical protein